MSSPLSRRAGRNRQTPRVPKERRTQLRLELLEDRTLLDATGIIADSTILVAAKQITRDFFTPQLVQTKDGVTMTPQAPGVYLGKWVVGLPAGASIDAEASSLGATSGGATGLIQNTYFLDFGSQAAQDVYGKIQWEAAAGRIQWYYPLLGLNIVPNFVPNDPLYPNQWHLNNTGQNGGTAGQDIRAQLAWDQATGLGVNIGVVDDGVALTHPDLAPNLLPGFDFFQNDSDPSAGATDPHGTAVAGMIAAKGNNSIGVTGVAFNSKIVPLRIFSATTNPNLATTDATIANALAYQNQSISIYNNSWGPAGGSPYYFTAGPLTLAAYLSDVTTGRAGKGNVIVRSAGNGGSGDNVNRNTLVNSRNVIAVASVNNQGKTNAISTPGAAILVSAPANPNVSSTTAAGTTLSTDLLGASGYNGYAADNNYTSNFGDTSAAAAVVSGVTALMLQKNPNLTFSDVQEILARTARKNDPTNAGWALNGAGLNIHNNYGFGVVDANAAVTMAGTWIPKTRTSITSGTMTPNLAIPDANATGITVTTAMAAGLTIQAVEVQVSVPNHTWRGDLSFQLTAPSGTVSQLVQNNISDSNDGLTTTFMTWRDLGESSGGTWSLKVADGFGGDTGTLVSWKLNIYGTVPLPQGATDTYTVAEDTLLTVTAPGVLGNDTASTGALLVTSTTNGTLNFNNDGSFTYKGFKDYNGPDSFTYRPTQGALQGNITTVNINVTPVNDAPVSNPDGLPDLNYVARPGVPLTIPTRGVLANDTDIDNNPLTLTAQLATAPTKGSVTLNPNGSFTYTARASSTGPDAFTYRASDGSLFSNPATVSLQVNTPAVSRDDSYNMVVGGTLNGGVLVNDTDLDQDSLKATLVTGAANGTLALNDDGTFTYTPNPGFFGIDTFVYRADDPWYNAANPDQIGNNSTVSIRVDRLPVATPDFFSVDRDSTLEVFLPGVLANDYDQDTPLFGDIITAELVSNPAHGTLTFGSNGYVKYVPVPGYYGPDSFTYRGNDGLFDGLPATVSIDVIATPVANPDSYVTFGGPLNVPAATGVLANDSSPMNTPLSAIFVSGPSNGSVTLNPDGSFSYAPINGYVGVDSFTYVANDGVRDSHPATVSISVFGLNRAPVANNDAYTVTPNVPFTALTPGILGNDTDADGDVLQAYLVTGPTNGTLLMNLNGSFTYTPLPGFVGTDTFTYQASDGMTLSNTATVTLTVGAVQPPPANPARRIVLSQDVGGQVKVFAGETGQSLFSISAFPGFTGSTRVATGDVTGDSVPDIFVAPGAQTGTAAALKVRGFDGVTGLPLPGVLGTGLAPFGTTYKRGMQVAVGDVNNDGTADLIVGADYAAAPYQVRVYNGATGTVLPGWAGGFKPYAGTTFGGVRVAAGDVNGDGRDDVIVSPGAGASPQVKVYNLSATSITTGLIRTLNAYSAVPGGGIYVSAGDLNGDGRAEIITGAAKVGTQGHVRVFDGSTGSFLRSLTVAGSTSGPARVALGDIDGDGKLDLVVGLVVSGTASKARVYDATTLQEMFAGESRFTFGGGYTAGLFAAALNQAG